MASLEKRSRLKRGLLFDHDVRTEDAATFIEKRLYLTCETSFWRLSRHVCLKCLVSTKILQASNLKFEWPKARHLRLLLFYVCRTSFGIQEEAHISNSVLFCDNSIKSSRKKPFLWEIWNQRCLQTYGCLCNVKIFWIFYCPQDDVGKLSRHIISISKIQGKTTAIPSQLHSVFI